MDTLIAEGVPPSLAAEWIATYGTTRVQRVVTYMRQREAQGHRIRSRGGFVRRALEENWPIKLQDAIPESIAHRHSEARRRAVIASREEMAAREAKLRERAWCEETKAGFMAARAMLSKAGHSQQEGVGV